LVAGCEAIKLLFGLGKVTLPPLV